MDFSFVKSCGVFQKVEHYSQNISINHSTINPKMRGLGLGLWSMSSFLKGEVFPLIGPGDFIYLFSFRTMHTLRKQDRS